MKKLSDYLKSIGSEVHDPIFVDGQGTIRPITKDEVLAREIWKRALGYEAETVNADGSVSHRVFQPDPKAQSFIFERREGKFVAPIEEKSAALLERVSELVKSQVNTTAEEIVDDSSSN